MVSFCKCGHNYYDFVINVKRQWSHKFEKLLVDQTSLVKMMTQLCDVYSQSKLRYELLIHVTNLMANITYQVYELVVDHDLWLLVRRRNQQTVSLW